MKRYHGRVTNALARTLHAPAVHVRPWGRFAWLLVAALAAAALIAAPGCGAVDEALGPIPIIPFRSVVPVDGGVR